jgi:hypothetical protein
MLSKNSGKQRQPEFPVVVHPHAQQQHVARHAHGLRPTVFVTLGIGFGGGEVLQDG